MPEGPELFLASRYINAECAGITFTGKVEKSEISKNLEVPFESDGYLISAVSRGKELKLTLSPLKREGSKECPMDLVFRFGMTGNFKMVPVSDMPKHAHLRFYTQEKPPRALCYVDIRRFGKWEVDGTWQADRGPCVMLEYEQFRDNVLRNLSDKAFNKPICEALLNQKFFNGVGNYLRAEILHRSKIAPFEKARTILEDLQRGLQVSGATLSKKVKLKRENPDLLETCHLLPMEAVNLGGGKGYDPTNREGAAVFVEWLHCYSVPGMKSLRDSNGRTIWFQGDPGPLAPKERKSQKKKTKPKPAVQSSKAPKPRRNSTSSPAQKEAKGRKKRRPENGVTQEKEEDGMVKGARGPKTRSQRSSSDLQESLLLSTPTPARKRRTPAQKTQSEKGKVVACWPLAPPAAKSEEVWESGSASR
ncbi:endonuclease 8-like 1 isoform X1 [Pantherophis guttatus]|uniref:DNA-(apurinic or apyrimidinic site) lyase n=1 Tax=Pantherophis guttatus TaxID=94885 RepID=A0ABM3ZAR6_PANGU|nr:endonuclease 8-like 1 isoform X1 [Pantherophis guttatus]XP_060545460.1 endonuclease 8-like 1 isoform X1 [Pantherophis guttatus]